MKIEKTLERTLRRAKAGINNPKKDKAARRVRPKLEALPLGTAEYSKRPECGAQKPFRIRAGDGSVSVAKRPPVGTYLRSRELPPSVIRASRGAQHGSPKYSGKAERIAA